MNLNNRFMFILHGENIRDNPDIPWDWFEVSCNPNIMWEIIRDNIISDDPSAFASANDPKSWDWWCIYENPNITWEINPKI